MASKTTKAPTARNGDASGIVVHCQAFNVPEIAPDLAEVQTKFIARRTRLAPHLAAIVAGLAFGGSA